MTEHEQPDSLPTIPPQLLVRSFLNIASGGVLCFLLFLGIAIGLAAACFPEVFANMTSDDPDVKARIAASPADFLPRNMFLMLLGLHALASVGVGWLTARIAPFAPKGHAFFLAIFIFVAFLQTSITGNDGMRGMVVCFMFVTPLAIFLGGQLFARNQPMLEESTSDSQSA